MNKLPGNSKQERRLLYCSLSSFGIHKKFNLDDQGPEEHKPRYLGSKQLFGINYKIYGQFSTVEYNYFV